MHEQEIRLTSVIAGVLWVAGLTLVIVGIAGDHRWSNLGLYLTAIATVLCIRRAVQDVVHARQNVFDMGRDYERGLAHRPEVSSIR